MEFTFQYNSTEERESFLSKNSDKYLIAEKNIKEGNFLVFTDIKPLPTLNEEVGAIKARVTDLELTIAEIMTI